MAKSKYLARKNLDHNLGLTAYAKPEAVYLALFTSVDGLAEGLLDNELEDYVRASLSFTAAQAVTDGGEALTGADAVFDTATSDWGAVVGWAIMDALTGGNVLYFGEMPKYGTPPEYKRIFAGDRLFIRAGEFSVAELSTDEA